MIRFPHLLALASLFAVHAGETWRECGTSLFASVPGYDARVPGARGVGGIAVDRHSGDLLAGLQGPPWGVYRSRDGGSTWVPCAEASQVAGGWSRPGAIQIDQDEPGRMAFFRVGPPAPMINGKSKPISGLTLDGGKTWTVIEAGAGNWGVTGWQYGVVDWSKTVPVIIAQTRIRPELRQSQDGGRTFQACEKIGIKEPNWNYEYRIALKDPGFLKLIAKDLAGYGVVDGTLLMGSGVGIERKGADAKRNQVSDLVPTVSTPVRFQGRLYWGGQQGVLVSADQGASWSLQGSACPGIRQGPFFGADQRQMVVVTDAGVFRSGDAGTTWTRIAELYRDPTCWRPEVGPAWQRHSYAWDHTRHRLYVAGMAGSIHCLEVAP